MTTEVERLVRCFEQGAISRRELIAGLGALFVVSAPGTEAVPPSVTAQSEPRRPIPLSGIDHIALRVSDLARSTAFYRDRLGGRIRSTSSDSTFLDVGSRLWRPVGEISPRCEVVGPTAPPRPIRLWPPY